MSAQWSWWLALAGAGAFHGLNPAMGWLFAVGLGMQDHSRATVLRAFPFIAAGHALSIGMVVLVYGVLAFLLDPRVLQLGGAGVIIAFGVRRAIRWKRHPRWVGMRVGPRDLVIWSFVMATAHGAGLMLVPVLLHLSAPAAFLRVSNPHVLTLTGGTVSPTVAVAAIAVHTAAMIAVSISAAVTVYEVAGVGVLRRIWVNFDLPWAAALIGAGILMAVL